jgi:hypothetical protein
MAFFEDLFNMWNPRDPNRPIGDWIPGGAGGAMDMFGDKQPSTYNLGIQNAPMSVMANQAEAATGIPFNSVGMRLANNVGNALVKMAPAMQQAYGQMNRQPQPQQLKPPPNYGHFPSDNLTSILNRAGYITDPMQKLRLQQLGLLGPSA